MPANKAVDLHVCSAVLEASSRETAAGFPSKSAGHALLGFVALGSTVVDPSVALPASKAKPVQIGATGYSLPSLGISAAVGLKGEGKPVTVLDWIGIL